MNRTLKASSAVNLNGARVALSTRYLKTRPFPPLPLADIEPDELPQFSDDDVYEELDVDGDTWVEDRELALQIAQR